MSHHLPNRYQSRRRICPFRKSLTQFSSKASPAEYATKEARPPRVAAQSYQPVAFVDMFNINGRLYIGCSVISPQPDVKPKVKLHIKNLVGSCLKLGLDKPHREVLSADSSGASNEAGTVLGIVIQKPDPDPAYYAVDPRVVIGRRLSTRFAWAAEICSPLY
jgi:hypothetical protein